MRLSIPYGKFKPIGMKDLTWRTIIAAWENGLSDRQVSLRLEKLGYKGDSMTPKEIRELRTKNPDIADLHALIQDELIAKSKETVSEAVKNGDLKTAKWYLERKAADEFSTRQAVAFDNAVIELSLEDKEKALKQMIDNFESDDK